MVPPLKLFNSDSRNGFLIGSSGETGERKQQARVGIATDNGE
jgi:hypothetical protein